MAEERLILMLVAIETERRMIALRASGVSSRTVHERESKTVIYVFRVGDKDKRLNYKEY